MKSLKFAVPIFLLTITNIHAWSARLPENGESSAVRACSPCETWELYFSALVVQPTASNMHYAVEAIPLPLQSPNWNVFDVCPKYRFGFDIGGRGWIGDCGTNVVVHWEHFQSSISAVQQVGTQNLVGPFFEIGPDAAPYGQVAGNVCIRFDEASVDIGQLICVSDYLAVNLLCGVDVARIQEDRASFFTNPAGTITRTITTPLQFIGAGPEVGVEFIYKLFCELYLTGKTQAALLAGRMKNNTHYVSTSPLLTALGLPNPNGQNAGVQNRSALVPAFEEKLGLSYNFSSWCGWFLCALEVGYQAQIYLSALQSIDVGSEVDMVPVGDASVGIFARTFQRNISNFALAGPYVTLSVAF